MSVRTLRVHTVSDGRAVEDMIHRDNEATLNTIREAKQEVLGSAEMIRAAFEFAQAANPTYQLQRFAASQGWLGQEVEKSMADLERYYKVPGSPSALRAVGEAWTTQVGAMASELSGRLRKESLATDNRWTGKAAEAYGDVVTVQGEALVALKTIATTIHTTLSDLAGAIEAYWNALAIGVASVAAALAIAAAAVGGVVTAPAGIKFALGALTAYTTLAGVALNSLTTAANAARAQQVKLLQQVTTERALPGGRWPSATAEHLADASTKDGDKSDWEPR